MVGSSRGDVAAEVLMGKLSLETRNREEEKNSPEGTGWGIHARVRVMMTTTQDRIRHANVEVVVLKCQGIGWGYTHAGVTTAKSDSMGCTHVSGTHTLRLQYSRGIR